MTGRRNVGRGQGAARNAGRCVSTRRGIFARSAVLALCASAAFSETAPESLPDASIQASALVAQARHEREAGRLEKARELCRRAIDLAPGDASARGELARIDSTAAGKDAGATPSQVKPDAALKVQLVLSEARVAADRAELLAADGRNAEARTQLEPAIAALVQLDAELPPEARQELARLRGLEDAYHQAADAARVESVRADRDQSLAQAHEHSDRDQAMHRSVYQERLARVIAIKNRGHLEVALSTCRALVVEYPSEPEAEKLFQEILEAVHKQRRLTLDERGRELKKEVLERIEKSLIPDGFDGMPVFPDDFLTRHSHAYGLEFVPDIPPWREAILDRLSKRVSVDFDAQNGVEALNALARQAGLNLVIDPQLQAGAERTVTLKASNIQLDHALNWLTKLMDTTWSITKGAVYIGGTEEVEPVLAIHDVSVMVFQGQDHPGKIIAFSSAGAAGGAGLFQDAATDEKKITPEDVVDLMQKAVSPLTWKNPAYGITIRGTTLFVTAPANVHKLIDEFIRAQEHMQNVLVKVDARWLEIDDGFIEEIGVNWGNLASISQLVTPHQPAGLFRENTDIQYNGTNTNQLPATQVFIQPATLNSGLTLSGAMLRNTELSSVITAVERNSRGRVLASPSITTLNGVRSGCFFGSQMAYIADYDVVSSTLDPKIQVLTVGASLTIKPMVSADRKYVTMDFRPGLASVRLFTEILSAPRFITAGNATGFIGIFQYPIELPNIEIKESSTTIQVPDQGSLLVGGFGKNIDQEMAERVPFLGNIPFIGRLFGKRGRYSDRAKLYLLATVNIINYDELETTL